MFSETFALFQQEGYLARSCILSGLNALIKANVDDINKGLFYTAFFELSIGFERLMKLILVIDFMAKNDLRPMTDRELKNNYGHKIKSLYLACAKINEDNGLSTDVYFKSSDFEWSIISFLHEFALSARYYNLSKLSNGQNSRDPLGEWWSILYCVIHSDLSNKKLEKIQSESMEECEALGGNTFIMMTGLDGQLMTMLDAIMYPQLVRAAAPHMVWYVIKIFKPLYFLISSVVEAVHKIEIEKGLSNPTIPFMDEFFPFLRLEKKTVIRRRKWS